MQLKKYQDDLLDEFERFLDACRVEDSPARAFAQSTGEWLGYAAPYRPLPTTANNPQAEATPFVCLRVPTGGGKTFLAAHAIQRVTRSYLPSDYALTLWLVPTESIRTQTLRVLKDRESPAHKSIRREMGEFTVMEVSEALYIQPATLETGHVIIVATMQSFKREDTSGLTAYKENGHLMPHFRGITDKATVGNHSLVDVFRLRKAVEEKLKSGLQQVQQKAFKEILASEGNAFSQLAGEDSDLNNTVSVSDKNVVSFCEGRYAYDDPYSGFFQFRKHFFGVIGNLKSQGEEFDCAVYLDQMPEIEYWVRNVEKKPGSFWLPTSRHRFYPDFVAKLKDGRTLVVEYKGSKLSEAASEIEKNDIGQLWASRSENCRFVMVVDRNWQAIRDAI